MRKVWLVVMGTKGDDCLSNFIMSTNTYSVINKVNCPVLFVPEQAAIKNISKIAVVIDSMDTNLSKLSFLESFKEKFNSELMVAYVPPASITAPENDEIVNISLYDITSHLKRQKSFFSKIKEKTLKAKINTYGLINQLDILGIFFRGENMFQRLFHSNTTNLLINNPSLPLLVFPQKH